jgi:hypothetical protein
MTPELPARIAQLPNDKRGINDDRKSWRALKERLCPICGGPLGRWKWFIGGPLSAFSEHGWYLDLPGHHERPAVFVAVAGNSIEIQKRGLLQPYVRPARPVLGIEFWRQGKQLTEAEALPLLQAGYKVPE